MFFMELDRSTEALDILVTRVLCYLRHYKSGGLAVRFGQSRKEFQDFPFRVLIVCQTEERRDNIASRLLKTNPPIRSFVLLSTLNKATTDPLENVWVLPHPSAKYSRIITHGTR